MPENSRPRYSALARLNVKKRYPFLRTSEEQEEFNAHMNPNADQIRQTFLDDVLRDRASLDDIDDYVEQWHESGIGPWGQLWDWLGMSIDEYSAWVENPSVLEDLLKARKKIRDRYGFVPLCDNCHRRPGSVPWSSSGLPLHGGMQSWCSRCAVSTQLKYAREQAERIPELEKQMAELDASEPA